jgi:hypothetical protein
MLNSWKRRPNPTIVDYHTIAERDVEVNSQHYALAG